MKEWINFAEYIIFKNRQRALTFETLRNSNKNIVKNKNTELWMKLRRKNR